MQMESLDNMCESYVHGHSSRNAVVSSVTSGEKDVVELIEALGNYLTSLNVDTRCSALELLSSVLEALGTKQSLMPDDVHYLVHFYCDHLKDRAVVLPHVLTGLRVLATEQSLSQDDVLLISRSAFKEVYCQTLEFEERHKLFTMFLSLLTNHLPALTEFSTEFVMGYIQLLDGERDPRNLLVAFASIGIIVQDFDLVEDLFDVIACYFPIDFTPPPNDPMAISREALVQGLSHCLSATPKFAELCLPMLLDKMTSEVLSAKVDSLNILIRAAPTYGAKALEPFLTPLWSTIKKEMFKSSSKELQLACVAALKAISQSLSQPLCDVYLKKFVNMAVEDCGRHLKEPELKLMEPVVQLLCGIAAGSDPAAACVIPHVMPILLQLYPALSQGSHQQFSVLSAIGSFVKAAVTFTDISTASPLRDYKDAITNVLQLALSQTELVCKEMACTIFSDLLSAKNLLDTSEVTSICQHLKMMALTDSTEELHTILQVPLQSICKTVPSLAEQQLIAPLLLQLKVNPGVGWLLAALVITPSLAAMTLPPLLSVIEQLVQTDSDHGERYWQSMFSVSSALSKIVEQNAMSIPLNSSLTNNLIQSSQKAANMHWQCCTDKVYALLELLSTAVSLNARHASDRWCNDALEVLASSLMTDCCSLTCAPPAGLGLISLTSLLAAAPITVVSCWGDKLCNPLFQVCLNGEGSGIKLAVKAYASILNKHPEGKCLSQWVTEHMASLWNAICANDNVDLVTAWIWVTKALVMRMHKMGLQAAKQLLELCVRNDSVGAVAADGFKLILTDTKEVLNMACHANVKLFFKQHLFQSILPQLIIMEGCEGTKKHLLRALSHFLTGVPRQVIVGEFHRVLPLLMESLNSPDTDVKISSLNAVLSIMQDNSQSLSPHVTTLLPCLLTLATDKNSMVIRKAALQSIELLSSLPVHLIYPYQREVIQSLAPCLDDHKRLVRRAAVNARASWYII